MSIEEFTENMEMFRRYVSRKNEQDHIYIFEIPDREDLFWVRLSIRYEEDKIVGLAEDITKETLEFKKMEYERDYDLLTNILNRRAFNARLEQLFQKGKDVLGTAALMMIDLDNLKFLNDSTDMTLEINISRKLSRTQKIYSQRVGSGQDVR